jgi:tRNA pseudouridine55 synthase
MNGLLLIDKEKDMTSRDVVNIACKYLNTNKIGHTGTLDPNATGVLVLCVGNALKIVDLITSYDKTYVAEVILGLETDTLDITGNELNRKTDIKITKEEIISVLNSFIGIINQEVPLYSAVKVDGKKLYEYARENLPVKLPIKKVIIKSINLISDLIYENNLIKFVIKCEVSKGTYIRSLIRDIGIKLNIPSCMGDLKRIKQGKYVIEDCYKLDNLKNNDYKFISMKDALNAYPMIKVDEKIEQEILNGKILDKFFDGPIAVILNNDEEVIAIYETYAKNNKKAKPMHVFN